MFKKISIVTFVLLLVVQNIVVSLGLSTVGSAETLQEWEVKTVQIFSSEGAPVAAVSELPAGSAYTLEFDWQFAAQSEEYQTSYQVDVPEGATIGEQSGTVTTSTGVSIGLYAVQGQQLSVSLQEGLQFEEPVSGKIILSGETYAAPVEDVVSKEETQEVPESEDAAPEPEQESSEPVTDESTEEGEQELNALAAFQAVEIEENIITDFTLTQRNGDPIPSPLPNPATSEIELKATYFFTLPNDHTYGAGSTYTFTLPKQLEVFNAVNGRLGDFGTYTISKEGVVVFTFNENIEIQSDITGFIEVFSLIDQDLTGDTTQTIKIPVRDQADKEFTLQFSPIKKDQAFSKKGAPDRRYNATTLNWEIDVNRHEVVLSNAVLADPISDTKQQFVPGSIKVYELDVQLDGSVVQGAQVTNFDTTNFPINFGTLDRQAYRVVFQTAIVDDVGVNYPNNATLTWDDGSLNASATVAVTRGKALEKRSSAYDAKSQTITWEIKYNYNQKEIAQQDAVLTDVFGANQLLVDGSFEVREITINPETGAEIGPGTVVDIFKVTKNGTTGFDFQFQEDITKAYKITYKTTAENRVETNGRVTNKVTAGDNSVTAGRDVTQQVFSKSVVNASINYTTKTLNWKIVFNSDEYPMQDTRLVDTLPAGLTLNSHTITHGGAALVSGVDYTFAYNSATGLVEFDFTGLNPVTKEVVIVYNTTFDHNAVGNATSNYTNKAKLTWTPEGEETARSLDRTATFTPNNNTKLNGYKGGSYNAQTKHITWEIGVNYNNRDIAEAIVEDVFQGNQKLLRDSIKVYNMTQAVNGSASKGALVDPELYTVEFYEVGGQPAFRVKLGAINSAYLIEVKGDLNGELISAAYSNKAELIDGETTFPLSATVSVTNGGKYTSKSALQDAQNEQVLNWVVTMNATQSTIEKAQLTDKPSAKQLILKDTFKVYGTTVQANGSFAKNPADLLERNIDYTLDFFTDTDGLEYFELKFLDTMERPYILEYSTFLMADHNETVRNDAVLEGLNVTDNENTGTQGSFVVRYSAGDGGASGKVGKLTIYKEEASTEEAMPGIEFTLFDSTGTVKLFTKKTDENGFLTFENLRFGDYMLQETGIPEGYVSQYESKQKVTINREVTESTPLGNELTVQNFPIIYEVELTKTDAASEKTLAGATFTLEKLINEEWVVIQEDVVTSSEGILYLENLSPGDFRFIETKAPAGYLIDRAPIPFSIGERAIEVIQVTAENTAISRTSVEGTKTWLDGDSEERPTAIQVNLLRNGEIIDSATVTEETAWAYSFKDLFVTNAEGKAYTYTIEEVPVDGYTSTVDGFDITNLRVGEIAVQGTKTWLDDNSEERPESITVNLLQNGQVIDSQVVTAETDWAYTFDGLPEFDQQGIVYTYTITEDPIEGYETTINGFDVTNLRVGLTEVSGTKTWLDDNSVDRPESITVNLLQNGEVIDSQVVTSETEWSYAFSELPEFDEVGKAYEYTVTEDVVEGYEPTISGFDITNLRVGTTEVAGTKTWLDDNSPERPESITMNLLQNGKVIESIEVTAETEWTYSFEELDQYDEQGVVYTYTVEEQTVEGYETTIEGYDVTNLRVGTVDVAGTKTWLDDNSEERPESITVNLLQNGEVIDSQVVTSETEWSYAFSELPEFDDVGKAYEYTVTEEAVEGYETTIEGYDITNLRVGTTEVTGIKTWLDDNSVDRPESITINLLQNGKMIDSTVVTSETEWTYAFEELDQYDEQGVVYTYTVTEDAVEGYQETIEGYDVTNLRVGIVEVVGTKTWLDDNSEERPESITVNLLQNGEVIDSKVVTAETDWAYTFDGLPEFDQQGVVYTYTVEEQPVEGYQTTIEGYDITNLRVGMTSVEGEKVWEDNDFVGRPETITVHLLQNGELLGTKEVTSETDWTFAFTDLPKYDDKGKLYVYTVSEEAVTGYTTTIEDYTITNKLVYGEVVVTKVDEDNKQKVLEGAVFDLLTASGEEVQKGLVTDSNGQIRIEDLQPGNYMLIETKAPQGYVLDTTPLEFTIELNPSETILLEITNKQDRIAISPEEDKKPIVKPTAPTKPEGGNRLPNTATSIYNYGLAGLLFLLGGAWLVRRRKQA